MEMPNISKCDVMECFYNTKNVCHAMAINVGSDHSACDTFMQESKHSRAADSIGKVGACKVDHCRFNTSDLLCSAPSISVGHHENHADCETYMAR